MGYANGGQQPGPGQDQSWVETVVSSAADWVAGLFGGQAEERDNRRFAQNEAAFRAAANGGLADREFLRQRTGNYGVANILSHLPYAVSPSTGEAETPGPIGGWATGPARRHAEALLDGLDGWGGPPGSIPTVDEGTENELYTLAKTEGRDAAEAALEALAAALYGELPDRYRQAVERGVRDHYLGSTPVQAGSVGVLMAAGLAFALLRRKR